MQDDRVMRERTNKREREREREREKLENSREDFEGECKMIE